MVLPFQQHQKIRLSQQNQKNQQNQNQSLQSSNLSILKGVPFWVWDSNEHLRLAKETDQNCCFNHCVKCPTKAGREYPLFSYQKTIFDSLMSVGHAGRTCAASTDFKDKHLYLLKSTGLGASELFLRIMAWLCTRNDDYKNSQMVIVTGPNWDLAIKLMKRLKAIFAPKLGIYFQDKETVLNLNGCIIESYPSNHLDSFRSLTNPAFILLDESDMFRMSEQTEVRHVTERYVGKSDPYIVLVSTPNCPGSLMENIKKEPEETCIYKRLFMDYTYGLNRIYSESDIAKARMSPSWEREYCLKFAGRIGNLLSPNVIDYAISLSDMSDIKEEPANPYNIMSLGVDPGFGSSATALVPTEFIKERNIIRVLSAEEYTDHPNPQDIIDKIFDIHRKYWNCWVFCDGSNRGFLTSLKIAFGESIHYESAESVSPSNNFVIPVNFSKEHKTMISHLAQLFNDRHIAVPEQFDKLIISLKSAVVNEYSLDKEQSSYNDLFDALRLSLRCYKIE